MSVRQWRPLLLQLILFSFSIDGNINEIVYIVHDSECGDVDVDDGKRGKSKTTYVNIANQFVASFD